jgi:hypothetical protein
VIIKVISYKQLHLYSSFLGRAHVITRHNGDNRVERSWLAHTGYDSVGCEVWSCTNIDELFQLLNIFNICFFNL